MPAVSDVCLVRMENKRYRVVVYFQVGQLSLEPGQVLLVSGDTYGVQLQLAGSAKTQLVSEKAFENIIGTRKIVEE